MNIFKYLLPWWNRDYAPGEPGDPRTGKGGKGGVASTKKRPK